MLLCPEQSHTSPNRTSLMEALSAASEAVIVYGPLCVDASKSTIHTALAVKGPEKHVKTAQ